jgi:5-methylcytosine-specific restriction endonuclease McrA
MPAKSRAGIVGAQWLKVREVVRQQVKAGRPCAICLRPIDLRSPDQGGPPPRTRWSFSVDHLEPRSKGGAHFALANLRPAHYGCNSRRGNGTKRMRTIRQVSRW